MSPKILAPFVIVNNVQRCNFWLQPATCADLFKVSTNVCGAGTEYNTDANTTQAITANFTAACCQVTKLAG